MQITNRADRAKQFTPFDALKGFREAIAEQEIEYTPKKILSEDSLNELDRKLHEITPHDTVTITFYNGTTYEKVTGAVHGISTNHQSLVINHLTIYLKDIASIDVI